MQQTDNESGHIIEIMKEEKQALYQKIADYDKEMKDKTESQRKAEELEGKLGKLKEELNKSESKLMERGMRINELEEQLKQVGSA